jgi:hypothetical protein
MTEFPTGQANGSPTPVPTITANTNHRQFSFRLCHQLPITTGFDMLKQQSHIVAPIPDELRSRALSTVTELRNRGKADKQAIDQLFELIVEMTDSGLDFFFLEPLRRLNASSMLMGMARVGISSMLKGSKMVVHKVLKKLDDRSLAAILDFIEEIIHEPETA